MRVRGPRRAENNRFFPRVREVGLSTSAGSGSLCQPQTGDRIFQVRAADDRPRRLRRYQGREHCLLFLPGFRSPLILWKHSRPTTFPKFSGRSFFNKHVPKPSKMGTLSMSAKLAAVCSPRMMKNAFGPSARVLALPGTSKHLLDKSYSLNIISHGKYSP